MKFIIKGRVQGVWFRASVKEEADKLHVKGYARNMPDGTVEVVAQGDDEQVERLQMFCRKGPEMARVDSIDSEVMSEEKLDGFKIN